jgi:hypothetical protein
MKRIISVMIVLFIFLFSQAVAAQEKKENTGNVKKTGKNTDMKNAEKKHCADKKGKGCRENCKPEKSSRTHAICKEDCKNKCISDNTEECCKKEMKEGKNKRELKNH